MFNFPTFYIFKTAFDLWCILKVAKEQKYNRAKKSLSEKGKLENIIVGNIIIGT